jgi:hypothetical protein
MRSKAATNTTSMFGTWIAGDPPPPIVDIPLTPSIVDLPWLDRALNNGCQLTRVVEWM